MGVIHFGRSAYFAWPHARPLQLCRRRFRKFFFSERLHCLFDVCQQIRGTCSTLEPRFLYCGTRRPENRSLSSMRRAARVVHYITLMIAVSWTWLVIDTGYHPVGIKMMFLSIALPGKWGHVWFLSRCLSNRRESEARTSRDKRMAEADGGSHEGRVRYQIILSTSWQDMKSWS